MNNINNKVYNELIHERDTLKNEIAENNKQRNELIEENKELQMN